MLIHDVVIKYKVLYLIVSGVWKKFHGGGWARGGALRGVSALPGCFVSGVLRVGAAGLFFYLGFYFFELGLQGFDLFILANNVEGELFDLTQ